jgi:alpha-beta hydrolase superfamily lysophospholipase
MYQRSEGFFEGNDGSSLFYQRWAAAKPKATLIITHGQAEHSGCYHRLIDFIQNGMTEIPLEIYAWDLRGHGRSDGLRGYAEDFAEYVKDYALLLRHLDVAHASAPLYLLGHSMGALIQFRELCSEHDFQIAGQILCSPMFGLSMQIPAYKEKAAGIINLLAPKLTMGNEINFENLTRDPDILKEYEQDTLRHDRISAGVFLGSQRVMSEIRAMALRVETPTLLLMSEDDPVTSTPAALEILSRMEKAKTRSALYSEAKHELFNDICRDEVFAEFKKFLLPAQKMTNSAADLQSK